MSDPAGPPTQWSRVVRGATAFRVSWAVIVLVTVVFRVWTVGSWSYFQDDWVYLTEASDASVWSYVVQSYNGHLMPAGFLLVWLSTALDPLDYTWVVVATTGLSVAVLVGWGLALREIFGERLHLLVALVLLAFTPTVTSASLWWAASLQYLPFQAAGGFAVWFLARYLLRGGRRRDVVGVFLAVLVGLLFWQKAVLIAVPLFFLPLLVGSGPWRDRLRFAWPALRPVATLLVVYVPLYVLVPRPSLVVFETEFPRAREPGQVWEYLRLGTTDIGLPSLFGGPFQDMASVLGQYGPVSDPLRITFSLVAGVLVLVALRYRRRAAWALGMGATYCFLSWGSVLFSSRYDEFGVQSVYAGRYVCDILPVLLLTCLFLATRVRTASAAESLTRPITGPARQVVHQVLLVYLVVASVLGVSTSLRTWEVSEPSSPKPWVDHVVADALAAGSAAVYDTPAPDNVINGIFLFERGNLSDVLAPLGLPLKYNGPAPTLLVADADGRFYEGEVASPAAASPTPGPVPGCGFLLQPGTTSTIPLSASLYDYEWALQLDYFTAKPGELRIATTSKSIDASLPATAPGALSRLQMVVVDEIEQLDVTLSAESAPVCVTVVSVGAIQASVRRPTTLPTLD